MRIQAPSSHISSPLNLSLAKLLLSHGQSQVRHLCGLRPVVSGELLKVPRVKNENTKTS